MDLVLNEIHRLSSLTESHSRCLQYEQREGRLNRTTSHNLGASFNLKASLSYDSAELAPALVKHHSHSFTSLGCMTSSQDNVPQKPSVLQTRDQAWLANREREGLMLPLEIIELELLFEINAYCLKRSLSVREVFQSALLCQLFSAERPVRQTVTHVGGDLSSLKFKYTHIHFFLSFFPSGL